MAAQGQNRGFHVLDEFVREAIHAPSMPLANPTNQGQNAGMSVVEELVFEVGNRCDPDRHENELKSAVKPLANYVAASDNRREALVDAVELLITELNGIDPEAARMLEQIRSIGRDNI